MPPDANLPLGPEVAAQSVGELVQLASQGVAVGPVSSDISRWSTMLRLPFVRAINVVERACMLDGWAKRGLDALGMMGARST
jgi:hypothetical protein